LEFKCYKAWHWHFHINCFQGLFNFASDLCGNGFEGQVEAMMERASLWNCQHQLALEKGIEDKIYSGLWWHGDLHYKI
jgi:hypothetical protein